MKLIFLYNISKKDELLQAFNHHEKKNPKTYVFKKAYSLDGEHLKNMVAVHQFKTKKEIETYKSNQHEENKRNTLIYNFRNNL